jgi:nucleoside-diphosphate-sugar epimerase
LKIAVTGGSGFTGRFVVDKLLSEGHTVRCLARRTTDRGALAAGAGVFEGDLDDSESLRRFLTGSDVLVNVASLGFGHASNVVRACEAASVRRGVFFSTTSIFTELPSASRAVRVAAEETVRASQLSWTILRPTMIYGTERDRNMSRMIRFLNRAPFVPLPGGGSALVQPVHVEDLAEAVARTLQRPETTGRAYDLPGADPAPLRAVLRFVLSELGRHAPILTIPSAPAAALAGLWQVTGLPPRVSREQVLRLSEDKAFPYDEARRDLDFRPRSWKEGLAREVERLREIGWIQ